MEHAGHCSGNPWICSQPSCSAGSVGIPFAAGVWSGGKSCGTEPLIYGVWANSGQLVSELNWIVGYTVGVGESRIWLWWFAKDTTFDVRKKIHNVLWMNEWMEEWKNLCYLVYFSHKWMKTWFKLTSILKEAYWFMTLQRSRAGQHQAVPYGVTQ